MVRIAGPRGDDWAHEPTPWRRLLVWLRHYSTPVMLALVVVNVATSAIVFVDHRAVWADAVGFPAAILLFFAMWESGAHAARWCERCIWRRVTCDPQAAAEAARRRLWFFHLRMDRPRRALAVYVVGFGAAAFTPGVVGFGLYVAWMAAMAVVTVSDAAHSWHHLRCPWCGHGDGGGDGFVEPAPDPVGTSLVKGL